MPTVLLVEDNRTLSLGLKRHLESDGFTVEAAFAAASGLRSARRVQPDVIILDLMLPDEEGYAVLRALRAEGSRTPVLVLTARTAEEEVLEAFRLGADDYVRKPFRVRELIARLRVLMRRVDPMPPHAQRSAVAEVIRFGSVSVNTRMCTVERYGTSVPLRPKEYDLLVALLQRDGAVVSRAELLRSVWGYDPLARSRTVDTHILELRRKLEEEPNDPAFILTVRTRGYRLRRSEEPSSRAP